MVIVAFAAPPAGASARQASPSLLPRRAGLTVLPPACESAALRSRRGRKGAFFLSLTTTTRATAAVVGGTGAVSQQQRRGTAVPRSSSSSRRSSTARPSTVAARATPNNGVGGGSGEKKAEAIAVPAPSSSSSTSSTPPPSPFAASPLDRDIFSLLLPALAAVFLEPAMQVADTAIVGGRLGVASLAALGLSNVVYFFSTAVFSFLLVVTTPAVAAAEAKGDRGGSSEATSRALWAALGIGVLLAAALWVGAPALLNALAPPEAAAAAAAKAAANAIATSSPVAAAAVPHLRLRALGAPATLALLAANGAFRGHRDTKTPLVAGAAQIGVHLLLDAALLIFLPSATFLGNGSAAALTPTLAHAAGAATTGAFVGAAVMVAALLRRDLLRSSDLRVIPSVKSVVQMLVPGLPLAACIGAVAAAVLGASAAAASLGAVALAAHAVVKQVVDFALAAFGTFSTVSQSLVAAALGAGDLARARASVRRLMVLGCGLGLGAAGVILAAAPKLPSLFTPDAAVGAAAAAVLPVVAALMPLAPAGSAMEGALLGSMRVAHVGARTVAAAGVSLGVLHVLVGSKTAITSAAASSASLPWWGGLTGVWIASASLLFFNAAADGALLLSRSSPLKGEEKD